jgi:hypothetical protein
VVDELVVDELVVVEVVDVVVDPAGQTVVTPSTFKVAGTSDAIGVPTGTLNTKPPST